MKHFFCLIWVTSLCFSQQSRDVDFKKAQASIVFGDCKLQEVSGKIIYEFDILKDIDSIYLDAKRFKKVRLSLDGQFKAYHYNGKKISIKHLFKSGASHKMEVAWETNPKKAMYFVDWEFKKGKKQIWTQGQGKYTSNWLPSLDDMTDKIEFDLSITFDAHFEVVANGALTHQDQTDTTTTWHYNMTHPMSSYLVALAIGDYRKKTSYSKSGIPIEMYFYPEDSLRVEPTYRYTKHMFDFLEHDIGVPYPWQNYKQVPVKDFLYAGMENTGTTIFSDNFVIDSIAFVDKNYVNVNAHEMAHQWFGNLVTETSGTHHWLQEGFATYYALLVEKELFGSDYFYWKLYEYAQELRDQDMAGLSTSLLNPKASSLTFYKKGAWLLFVLRDKVGDLVFKKAVQNYLKKHQYKNVQSNDFIYEVEQASGSDLSGFVENWLVSRVFQYDYCIQLLKEQSALIFKIEEFEHEQKEANLSKERIFEKLGGSGADLKIKTHIIQKIDSLEKYHYLIKNVFDSNDIKARQAIAKSLHKIPVEFKRQYASLLDDKSYATKEIALFNLWQNFPEDRSKYLDETRNIHGFDDKNIRLLWLTLALLTETFEPENKSLYFKELVAYTGSEYASNIRQKAFQYLNQIQACNTICKDNLNQATKHHNWRLAKFAKELLKK